MACEEVAPLTLLGLPAEIREQIWGEVVAALPVDETRGLKRHFDLAILRTSKQIYVEAVRVFRTQHTFVDISTPWKEAHAFVSELAKIRMVTVHRPWNHGARLTVTVLAPGLPEAAPDRRFNFVILAEDLVAFCNHWYDQCLDRPEMNSLMTLHLELKNLDSPMEPLLLSKQTQLLQPFGRVKALRKVQVTGAQPVAEEALRKEMHTPIDSPTVCLTKATAFKEEANAALKAGKYEDALDLYSKAFACIFIRVEGRMREVHGEGLFNVALEKAFGNERFGQVVYFLLRTTLVANMVEVYLKMKQWSEAQFWGLRSINLLREIAGESANDPNDRIPGTAVWGKIYYRTGVASEQLDEMSEARGLYRIAKRFLPHDELVAAAVTRTALKLG